MPDVETATTQLYEDAGLTEDLVDEEANALLKWAEAQIPIMIARYTDETAFDERFKALRTLVKSVNRLFGQPDDPEKQERMAKIAESASALGYPVNPVELTDFTAQSSASRQTSSNNVEAIKSLLERVSSSAQAASTPDVPALPPSTPVAHGHYRTFEEETNDQEKE
jgi:hypothetical protein